MLYKLKPLFIALFCIFTLLLTSLYAIGVTEQVTSFTGQTNPFNITFTAYCTDFPVHMCTIQNKIFNLPIPQYGYVNNVTFGLKILQSYNDLSSALNSKKYVLDDFLGSSINSSLWDYYNYSAAGSGSKANSSIKVENSYVSLMVIDSDVASGAYAGLTSKFKYNDTLITFHYNATFEDANPADSYKGIVTFRIYNNSNLSESILLYSLSDSNLNYTNGTLSYFIDSVNKRIYLYENATLTSNTSIDGIKNYSIGFDISADTNNLGFPIKVTLNISSVYMSSNFMSNLLVYSNNLLIKNTSYTNGSDMLISANTSYLNSVLASNNPINFTFVAGIPGILQVNLTNATYSYGIDNCTNSFNIPSNATALNISFYDYVSNSLLQINGSINMVYYNSNFSQSIKNRSNLNYCIYPNWANLTTNISLQYWQDYTYPYNYINALYLTNNSELLRLYLQTGAYQSLLTTLDTDSNPISNVVIKILRYEPTTSSFLTSEILTSDSNGHAIANLIINSIFYRFILEENGNVVLTESSSIITPSLSSSCPYSVCKNFYISDSGDNWFSNALISEGVINSLYFNNDTDNFVFNWDDTSQKIHLACLKIMQVNISGETYLSDNCQQSTAGTIIYHVSETTENKYIATSYLKYDDIIPLQVITKEFKSTKEYNNPILLVIGIAICLILVLIGAKHPTTSMVGLFLGLIICGATKLWLIATIDIASIIILGIITWVVGNRQQ